MSGNRGLSRGVRARLFLAVLGCALCGPQVSAALADRLSGGNTLENVERGETEGDWVEYWSDKQDGIWIVVVQGHKVVEVIAPGDPVDKKAKAALLKQRAAAGVTAAATGPAD